MTVTKVILSIYTLILYLIITASTTCDATQRTSCDGGNTARSSCAVDGEGGGGGGGGGECDM